MDGETFPARSWGIGLLSVAECEKKAIVEVDGKMSVFVHLIESLLQIVDLFQ